MMRRVSNALIKRGLETAVQVTAETAVNTSTKSFVRMFEVALPTTVYIRASNVEVTVCREPGTRVELSAQLRGSFGWELAAEQDSAGVYIVAKRKRVVGALSAGRFTVTVPPQANLVFHLTPGEIRFVEIDGKLTIPGAP